MSTVFCNLVRGNMVSNYMGIKGEVNKDYKFGKDYSHIEVQLSEATTVEAGDFVILRPSITVDPKKVKIMVVPNFKLAAVGSLSYAPIVEAGEGEALGFSLKVEYDFDLSKLDYLCRLYAIYE